MLIMTKISSSLLQSHRGLSSSKDVFIRHSSSFCLFAVLCVCNAAVKAGPQEDRLLNRFFVENKYFPTSRPVANDSESVMVKFGINNFRTFELVSF